MTKRKFRWLMVVVALAVVLASAAWAAPEFWASRNSDKYHYPNCPSAKRINAENLITFETPEAARKAGYVPCKKCRPPVSSE